jgi:hypothetical protein
MDNVQNCNSFRKALDDTHCANCIILNGVDSYVIEFALRFVSRWIL